MRGKPRLVVIVSDDGFDGTGSITICALATDPTEAPLVRLAVAPNPQDGLEEPSRPRVDKITTMSITKIGARVGWIGDADLLRLDRASSSFSSSRAPREQRGRRERRQGRGPRTVGHSRSSGLDAHPNLETSAKYWGAGLGRPMDPPLAHTTFTRRRAKSASAGRSARPVRASGFARCGADPLRQAAAVRAARECASSERSRQALRACPRGGPAHSCPGAALFRSGTPGQSHSKGRSRPESHALRMGDSHNCESRIS